MTLLYFADSNLRHLARDVALRDVLDICNPADRRSTDPTFAALLSILSANVGLNIEAPMGFNCGDAYRRGGTLLLMRLATMLATA